MSVVTVICMYGANCICEGVGHVFDDGMGLLHMACISQNLAAVQCLVAAGADTGIRDTQGQTTFLPRDAMHPRY